MMVLHSLLERWLFRCLSECTLSLVQNPALVGRFLVCIGIDHPVWSLRTENVPILVHCF
jgi:hypothetical protein